jgi:hypothetical protein
MLRLVARGSRKVTRASYPANLAEALSGRSVYEMEDSFRVFTVREIRSAELDASEEKFARVQGWRTR